MQPDEQCETPHSGSELLLKALKELSPGRIYTLAPPGEVLDAITLIRRHPVRNINWNPDGSTLTLEVTGHPVSEISISLSNGGLTTSCDCGTSTACRHIVAVLATLKKLISPESFRDILFEEQYRAELSGSLFGRSVSGRSHGIETGNVHGSGTGGGNGIDNDTGFNGGTAFSSGTARGRIYSFDTGYAIGTSPGTSDSGISRGSGFRNVFRIGSGKGPMERTSTFKLLVEQNASGIMVRPSFNNSYLYGQDSGLSINENRFMGMMYIQSYREKVIHYYLDTLGDDAPIVFRTGDAEIPLRYFPGSVRKAKTLLDVSAGVVTIQKVFDDAQPLADGAFTTPHYHFDIPAGRIEPIDDASDWSFWDHASRAAATHSLETRFPNGALSPNAKDYSKRLLTLGVQEFNRLGLAFPIDDVNASLTLAVNGRPALIEERALVGKIRVTSFMNERSFRVLSGMDAGETAYSLSSWPFGLLTESEKWRCSGPLRTKKRFSCVVSACFDLLHCTTEKEKKALLKTVFSGDDFRKRKIASEAKEFATSFAEGCYGNTAMLYTDGSRWIRYGMDRLDQFRLLEIPFRMFGPSAFTDTTVPGEIFLTRSELMPRLQELQSKIEAAGFQMLFNGKTVRSVKWEFTLDATRSSIDWFELRPEVKCEGGDVSAEELEQALKGGGLYVKGNEFVMLDTETSSILAILPKQETSHNKKNIQIGRAHV